jgi:hypothetical protein
MTRDEYEKKVRENGINIDALHIVIGRITNIPDSMGCYQDQGIWKIYKVGERQNLVVVEEGNEADIFESMYKLTLGMIED